MYMKKIMNDNENISYKDLEQLSLDPENPRLPESLTRTPEAIIDHIASTTSIEDLMSAIAENDFFPGEPLVVVPSDGKFIVVEGNRRLTAVRLLLNPNLCSKPSARMLDIVKNAKFKPESLPVVQKNTRLEVLPYLGFRHITGVRQWEPLAKARYMKQMFDLNTNPNPEDKYFEVGRAIGSRRDNIKRNLTALAVYRIIESNGFYNIQDLDEESIKFAVLSTAIADEKIAKFIGSINENGEDNHPIVAPGSLIKENIKDLTEWLYKKNEKGETKVGESRNLRELSHVIDTPIALKALRDGSTLNYAYRLTKGTNEDFIALLYEAEDILSRAAGFVANADYTSEALNVARSIHENITLIGKTLKEKEKTEDVF